MKLLFFTLFFISTFNLLADDVQTTEKSITPDLNSLTLLPSNDDMMKICLASEFGAWTFCKNEQTKCDEQKKSLTVKNCPDDVVTNSYKLNDSEDAIIVIKSKSLNATWILDTKSKTMIKI